MTFAQADAVLEFWFGGSSGTVPSNAATTTTGTAARPEWFKKDPAFDEQIRQRFGPLIDTALASGLGAWDALPTTALARIVVLDQFTRNVHRGRAEAFAGDALALAAARAMVDRGDDLALNGVMRWFAYLPFEHAESAATQAESLRLYAALSAAHPALADAEVWAKKHAEVIARFGRYPHRNAVLGRASTEEELAFLSEPGSSF